MAKVIGASQAWLVITKTLEIRNLNINSVEDIQKLLTQKKSDYVNAKEDAAKTFEYELSQLLNSLEQTKVSCQIELNECHKEYLSEIELSNIIIQSLREEHGIFKKIINNFKIREQKTKIENLKVRIKNREQKLLSNITDRQKEVNYKQSNRDLLIEKECQKTKNDINLVERILVSHEYAGAIAELELIEFLRKLPENFCVINNVKLVSRQAIFFDNAWLKSAQIDHLVVSPAGIFVIEAKSWSSEFAKQGNYFDPYQQVKRSSYMCYKFLEDKLRGAKVRSIIAYKGAIPEKPRDSFAKVLQFREVNGYITWFKENYLSDEQIKSLVNCIE